MSKTWHGLMAAMRALTQPRTVRIFYRVSAWLVSLYTYARCGDVDVGWSLHVAFHHHDHACSLGVHARQQCRCLHELWLQSIVACFESATILISTIACYRLHASCMLLRPCPVWHRVVISLPDLPGYCGRRSFSAIFRTYGRVLPKCRFSRSVLGGLL